MMKVFHDNSLMKKKIEVPRDTLDFLHISEYFLDVRNTQKA